MWTWLIAFIWKNPGRAFIVGAAVAAILASSGSGVYFYWKGHGDGKKKAEAVCADEKRKAADANLRKRGEMDLIRVNRPDDQQLIDSLQNGQF